jgi:hypothetical protein
VASAIKKFEQFSLVLLHGLSPARSTLQGAEMLIYYK